MANDEMKDKLLNLNKDINKLYNEAVKIKPKSYYYFPYFNKKCSKIEYTYKKLQQLSHKLEGIDEYIINREENSDRIDLEIESSRLSILMNKRSVLVTNLEQIRTIIVNLENTISAKFAIFLAFIAIIISLCNTIIF
jgi:hypothetical protein